MNLPIPPTHAAVFDAGGIEDDSGRVHQMLPPQAGLVTRCGLPADDLDVWEVLGPEAADCELCALSADAAAHALAGGPLADRLATFDPSPAVSLRALGAAMALAACAAEAGES